MMIMRRRRTASWSLFLQLSDHDTMMGFVVTFMKHKIPHYSDKNSQPINQDSLQCPRCVFGLTPNENPGHSCTNSPHGTIQPHSWYLDQPYEHQCGVQGPNQASWNRNNKMWGLKSFFWQQIPTFSHRHFRIFRRTFFVS